jgi:hypothetical protein
MRGRARARPARAGCHALRHAFAFLVRQPEAAHRPFHRRDADVHPARISHARAQLCTCEVVLLADQARLPSIEIARELMDKAVDEGWGENKG